MARNSQWQSASDEDWELALAREAVIRPLADQTEVTAGLGARASAELGISRSLVSTGSLQNSENVLRSQVCCQANEDVGPPLAYYRWRALESGGSVITSGVSPGWSARNNATQRSPSNESPSPHTP